MVANDLDLENAAGMSFQSIAVCRDSWNPKTMAKRKCCFSITMLLQLCLTIL
jgi:hypothetical protein